MTKWRRRSVLATGATLTAGGALASIGAGEESTDDDLPDPDRDPNPGMDEDWPSFDGGAGHARYVPDGTALDGDALENAWSVDGAAGDVAIADGVVYATPADDVLALDATDGSAIWENTEIDANAPSVVDDTVYVTRDELFALDAADGSIRWQTEFEPEDPIESQTVAYGTVFVVADGTLYALEPDDGSVRWEHESITVELDHMDTAEENLDFVSTTAAANGVVYAGVADNAGGATAAFDPETGDEVWAESSSNYSDSRQARATATAVTVGSASFYARHIADAQTGEHLMKATSEGISVVFGEERYVGGYDGSQLEAGSLDDGEERWTAGVRRNIYAPPVIVDDVVYLYFDEYPGQDPSDSSVYSGELVAFAKDDGSERWAISKEVLPVGEVLAVSGDTLYLDHDGELVALREETDEEDDTGEDGDEEDDTGEDNDDNGDGQGEDDGEPSDGDADEGETDDSGQPDGEDEAGDKAGDDEPEESSEGEDEEDDEDDEQYGGEEGDEDEIDDSVDETDDSVGETDDETGDDNGDDGGSDDDPNGDDDTGIDDGPNGDEGDDAGDDTDDGDDAVDADSEDDPNDETADDEADSVPGFTTGAGIAGGVLGLEWLRRNAGTNEQIDAADEPTEAPEDRTE